MAKCFGILWDPYIGMGRWWYSTMDEKWTWSAIRDPIFGTLISYTPSGVRYPQIRELCTLRADLSGLENSLQPQFNSQGTYYSINFKVSVRLGGTQLLARLQWEEGVSTIIASTSGLLTFRREFFERVQSASFRMLWFRNTINYLYTINMRTMGFSFTESGPGPDPAWSEGAVLIYYDK